MTEPIFDLPTGIVGLGNIGRYHAERLLDLGVPLVGGMDVAPSARERFRDHYGVTVYDDHEALYDQVEAVVITTPNKFHETYAVDAFKRNVHVLLEKPLAHRLDSAERIAEAARRAESYCLVGFNNRFANAVQVLKSRIERGELGKVTHIEANYVRRRGVPGRGSWFTRQSVAGGGALIDLGVHAIDLALYLQGYPPIHEVTGVTRAEFGARDDYAYLEMWGTDTGPEGFDVDDSASAFVRCGEDRSISLEVAWATNRPETHEFVVDGTKAAATFDLETHDLTLYSARRTGPDHLEDTTIHTRQNDTHTDEQRAFFRRIDRGEPDLESVEHALDVQRIVDAIYRSAESGSTVAVDG